MIRYVVVDDHGLRLTIHWTMEDALYKCPKDCVVISEYWEPDTFDEREELKTYDGIY